eukprot:235344_1
MQGPPMMIRTACVIGMLARPGLSWKLVVPRGLRRPTLRCASTTAADDNWSGKHPFFFPGQGAQSVGMADKICDEVPKAKQLFDEASDILGYNLLKKCKEGPKDELDSTAVSQPAIFVCSMAGVEKLRQDQGDDVVGSATCALGLSLGEYSALCFAGAISFQEGVTLTKARGEAMQRASDETNGGMASVVGLKLDVVEELCVASAKESGKPVSVANLLCDGNYAVSGDRDALKVLQQKAPEFKARMVVPLAVAGAFHTDFMAAAVPKLEAALSKINIKSPRIPVISNVDAKTHVAPDDIKLNLTKQVRK